MQENLEINYKAPYLRCMKVKTETFAAPTKEELEMVKLLAAGEKGVDMAKTLGVPLHEMNFSLTVLRSKYNCKNSTQLVSVFHQNNFLK